jgi:hypothetical protein
VAQRLSVLGPVLRSLGPGHLVAVTGGKVMGVHDFLTTRVVEQVVHLDDLARSVGGDPWSLPPAATALTIAVGNDIARQQVGDLPVVRALYRSGFAEGVFPVL